MKALLILLTFACAGLAGLAYSEYSKRMAAEARLADATEENTKLARRAVLSTGLKSGVVISETGPTGLEEKAKELGFSLEEEVKEKKPRLKKTPGEKSKADPEAPDVAKMLRDPAMRDTLRAQSEAYLEFQYRDLFDMMHLDEKTRDQVMTILKDRSGKQTDLGFMGVDPKVSAADREAASAEYTKFNKESEASLKDLLGDNYSRFERFEKSAPEREHLKTLNSMLKEKNLTLDEATETKLMDAMYDTRRNFHFDHDLSDTAAVSPNNLSRETVDRYVQQTEELQKQVQAKAKDLLTPEQFDVFVKSQTSQQQMTQLGIQMLRQMSGQGKEADARN